jgi:hypothetical protein
MALKRPPLIQLGGETCYELYEAEFERLYRSGQEIRDVRGVRVVFEAVQGEHPCKHVCFKREGKEADPYRQRPRLEWSQERAERIEWIAAVLTSPVAIHESHLGNGCLVYLNFVESDPRTVPRYDERFMVVVAPKEDGDVSFVTGYAPTPEYWDTARQKGKKVWPGPKPKPEGPQKKGKKRPKAKGQGSY